MPLRLKDWGLYYEVAKSRPVDLKSWGVYPLKFGLGWVRLVSTTAPDSPYLGAALYGAFMALLTLLHRHRQPVRNGWLTEDGSATGVPYSPQSLSEATRLPAPLFEILLRRLSDPDIAWTEELTRDGASAVPPPPKPRPDMTPGQLKLVLEQVERERDGLWNSYHFEHGKAAQDKAPGPWKRFRDLTERKAQLERQLADYGQA